MGGYNIQLKNPLIELQPSVFLLTDMQSFHADITARLEYIRCLMEVFPIG